MSQYNMVNVNLSNSQLNKLKSAIKNRTEVTLNVSSNLIGNSNDKTNFPHKLLSTDKQVSMIRKAFANGSSANRKFSKTQLSRMIESRKSLVELHVTLQYADFKAGTQELIKRTPELTKMK